MRSASAAVAGSKRVGSAGTREEGDGGDGGEGAERGGDSPASPAAGTRELREERLHGGEARGGGCGERAGDGEAQPGRDDAAIGCEGDLSSLDRAEAGQDVVAGERRDPFEGAMEGDGEAELVGRGGGGGTLELLGRGVGEGADHGAGGGEIGGPGFVDGACGERRGCRRRSGGVGRGVRRAGEAEVEDADTAVEAEDGVGGFEVAVNDADPMRRGESVGGLEVDE